MNREEGSRAKGCLPTRVQGEEAQDMPLSLREGRDPLLTAHGPGRGVDEEMGGAGARTPLAPKLFRDAAGCSAALSSRPEP